MDNERCTTDAPPPRTVEIEITGFVNAREKIQELIDNGTAEKVFRRALKKYLRGDYTRLR